MDKIIFKKGLQYLSNKDNMLAKIISNIEIKIPPKKNFDFLTFVSVIINQQLSGNAANTIRNRIIDLCGGNLTHLNFNRLSDDDLLKCGLSRAKISYIRNIATHLNEDKDFFKVTKNMTPEDFNKKLNAFKGIGVWSSSIIAIFYVGHTNIFPPGDSTLNKAILKLYDSAGSESYELIDSWSPYKSVAAICLWQWVDNGMKDFS